MRRRRTLPDLRPTRARGRRAVEALGAPVLWAALRVVRFYRPTFHQTSNWIHWFADRMGVYPVIDHYHEPLVSMRHIDLEVAERPRELPGIDLRIDAQLGLLTQLRYGEELEALAAATMPSSLAPTFDNLAYGPGDAEILYSLLRHLRPGRVLEVGSGHSTRFAKAALDRNRQEGIPARHVCIEPYESLWLEAMDVTVVRSPVEKVDRTLFTQLEANDVLFIDSSHVVRPQGDVLHLLHEVLPILAAGVVVHVHDVFTPRDYPVQWLARRWLWTEQYLLEALLVANPRYEILLALNHLFRDHRGELVSACPIIGRRPEKQPGSFWLRVRAPGD